MICDHIHNEYISNDPCCVAVTQILETDEVQNLQFISKHCLLIEQSGLLCTDY